MQAIRVSLVQELSEGQARVALLIPLRLFLQVDHPSRMSGSAVKCLSTPCVTSCPDAKVVIHPPPLVLTIPGLTVKSAPNQCLVETKTSCLTNGSDACGDGCSAALVTRSSGLRAISGGDTPCCTTSCPDSQLVIQPPPVCLTIPGAILTSYPNECLIETSTPCAPTGSQPHPITCSPAVCGTSPGSSCIPHSTSVPCDLNAASMECATQGPSSKVVIYPPPIEVTMPAPMLEIAAEECAVEVYNPCEGSNAITSGDCCAITSGDGGEVNTLVARACTTVCGVIGASTCVSQGPEMKMVIQPPPIEVDLPGPILRVFPEACKVETVSSCAPKVGELCSSNPPALCSNSNGTTSTALATKYSSSSTIKRPLPDIRRPARPWAEMYNRSLTPKRILANQSHITKYGRSFSSASYHSAY
ncbi:Feather keratin 3 [Varanus komodoensis]|nr:Feather keratin 3 [Varanus komodoensis]